MADSGQTLFMEEKHRLAIEKRDRLRREAAKAVEKDRAMMRQPFLDQRPLTDDHPPNCTLAGFKEPRLRQCPFQFDDISRVDKINKETDLDAGKCDGGLDGWNWKIHFDGAAGGPYVLKLV